MFEPDSRWTESSRFIEDLRPVVIRAGEVAVGEALSLTSDATDVRIRFPWWDSRSEAEPFLDWLRTCADGDTFTDLDQGWRIDARRLGATLHFLDQNFDSGEVRANVATGHAAFLVRLDAALAAAS